MTKLAFALADASTPLAADDLAGYRKQLPVINAALDAYFQADAHAAHGPLARFKSGPPASADLESTQKEFAPFSTVVADLVRAQHIHHRESLHLFECPMAPRIGKGRWLQRDGDLKNPFFGSGMLTCGEELDAPPAPTGPGGGMTQLPPGHPPLDAATLLAFKRPAKPAKTDGCCQSPAPAMSGESCEHASK